MSYGEACFNEGYEQGLDRGRQESKQLRAAARLDEAQGEAQQNIALIADSFANVDEKLNDLLDALQAYFNKYGITRKTEDIAFAMSELCFAMNLRGTPPR